MPYRLFSYDNPALKWSALDQVGSLLMAAGGMPFQLELPWPDPEHTPYILGVDLGHPIARRDSWVVMSLMDGRGNLIESWRHRQKLDETIEPRVLESGLRWAREKARTHGRRKADFMVIRDGRLHKGERIDTYRRILGKDFTFLELIKYDNPEICIPGPSPSAVPAGFECHVDGDETPYIVPVAPRLANDLARPFKLHMPPYWDGLNLGMETVSAIITGLCYTPGLGLATHALPGPIYWADGIAAIGETNHQFAGQKIRS